MQIRFSQTNLQLYQQMRELDYRREDLLLVHQSYCFSCQLLTGQFRATYKPAVAHLVGTASILAWLGCSVNVVVAGLLHAVYESGDFGDSQPPGASANRRVSVQSVVGLNVEDLITQYQNYAWNLRTIQSAALRIADLEQWESDIITIRLANELEDLLDAGLAYCGEIRRTQAIYSHTNFNQIVALADLIGLPNLARELEASMNTNNANEISAFLIGDSPPNQAFVIETRSYKKLKTAIAQKIRDRKG